MNQIKNNTKLFSYLGSEEAQNSILLCKNTGISITENTQAQGNIILQKKYLKNSALVQPKTLNSELTNLYNQNNIINSNTKTAKFTSREIEKQKLLNFKNIETEIKNNL